MNSIRLENFSANSYSWFKDSLEDITPPRKQGQVLQGGRCRLRGQVKQFGWKPEAGADIALQAAPRGGLSGDISAVSTARTLPPFGASDVLGVLCVAL